MEAKSARIVVGVDGSEASVRSLEWAARHAALIGGTVEAVSAWEVPAAYGAGMMVMPDDEAFDAAANQILDEALREAKIADAGVAVERKAVRGHPARVLAEAANGAELLVVGSRGRGGFKGMLLGSVSQYCVANAPCPVVVVRNTAG